MATATLLTGCLEPSEAERRKLEPEFEFLLAAQYGVKLGDVLIFKKVVRAKDLLEQLSFTKPVERWGGVLPRRNSPSF